MSSPKITLAEVLKNFRALCQLASQVNWLLEHAK